LKIDEHRNVIVSFSLNALAVSESGKSNKS